MNSFLTTNKITNWPMLVFFIIFALGFCFFSVSTAIQYPGNKMIFSLFCLASFSLCSLAFIGRFSYFYFFLSCFILLGFWFKTCTFFLAQIALGEPTGLFSYTPESWNKALIISSVGLFGVAFAKLLSLILDRVFTQSKTTNSPCRVPLIYKNYRKSIWFISFVFIIALCISNYYLNFYKIGVLPTHTLPLKLGALAPFMITIGCSLWLATLIGWDVKLGSNIFIQLCFVAISACLLSASALSRGFYLYQAGHYIISLLKNHKKIKFFALILPGYFLIFIFGLLLTLKLTTFQRSEVYVAASPQKTIITAQTKNSALTSSGSATEIFITLLTKRWIGLEGVMAVSSWPEKNKTVFYKGWSERLTKGTENPYPVIDQQTEYTKLNDSANSKTFFTSLPGFIAMLDYADNLGIVFGGATILVLLYLYLEKIISVCLRNPFFLSFYGVYLAMLVSMLGDGHSLASVTIEVILTASILYGLQSKMIPSRFFYNIPDTSL